MQFSTCIPWIELNDLGVASATLYCFHLSFSRRSKSRHKSCRTLNSPCWVCCSKWGSVSRTTCWRRAAAGSPRPRPPPALSGSSETHKTREMTRQIKSTHYWNHRLETTGKTHTLWNRGQGLGIWRDKVRDLMKRNIISQKWQTKLHRWITATTWKKLGLRVSLPKGF